MVVVVVVASRFCAAMVGRGVFGWAKQHSLDAVKVEIMGGQVCRRLGKD